MVPLHFIFNSYALFQVCTDAPTRQQAIMDQVAASEIGQDQFVQQFGLAFEPTMVQFNARQLPPVSLSGFFGPFLDKSRRFDASFELGSALLSAITVRVRSQGVVRGVAVSTPSFLKTACALPSDW